MKIFKIIIGYLNIPRLFLHIFLYWRNPSIHKEDILNNIIFRDRGIFINFICLLVYKKYYRTLFYHRIGRISYLIRFMCPDSGTLFFISPDTEIGPGMNCGHCFSSVVNAVTIGRNFSVYQNVTIGVSGGGKPKIKNNVTVFANSVVIGNITIGDNTIIGAGTVVAKSVPDNCVVTGNPAIIIKKDGEKVMIKL